jgi:hypothetical protein
MLPYHAVTGKHPRHGTPAVTRAGHTPHSPRNSETRGRCRRPTLSAGHDRLLINGDARDQAPLKQDYGYLAGRVAELLAAVGERLIKGDRLTGSIVQVPVRAGDRVVADLGSLGAAEAHIT